MTNLESPLQNLDSVLEKVIEHVRKLQQTYVKEPYELGKLSENGFARHVAASKLKFPMTPMTSLAKTPLPGLLPINPRMFGSKTLFHSNPRGRYRRPRLTNARVQRLLASPPSVDKLRMIVHGLERFLDEISEEAHDIAVTLERLEIHLSELEQAGG